MFITRPLAVRNRPRFLTQRMKPILKCCQKPLTIPQRINLVKKEFDRPLTLEDKRVLIEKMIKIMTDQDVSNDEIVECIHFLNEKNAW